MVKRTGNPFKDAIMIALHGVGAEQITCEGRVITCVYREKPYRMSFFMEPSAPGEVASTIDALEWIGAIPPVTSKEQADSASG